MNILAMPCEGGSSPPVSPKSKCGRPSPDLASLLTFCGTVTRPAAEIGSACLASCPSSVPPRRSSLPHKRRREAGQPPVSCSGCPPTLNLREDASPKRAPQVGSEASSGGSDGAASAVDPVKAAEELTHFCGAAASCATPAGIPASFGSVPSGGDAELQEQFGLLDCFFLLMSFLPQPADPLLPTDAAPSADCAASDLAPMDVSSRFGDFPATADFPPDSGCCESLHCRPREVTFAARGADPFSRAETTADSCSPPLSRDDEGTAFGETALQVKQPLFTPFGLLPLVTETFSASVASAAVVGPDEDSPRTEGSGDGFTPSCFRQKGDALEQGEHATRSAVSQAPHLVGSEGDSYRRLFPFVFPIWSAVAAAIASTGGDPGFPAHSNSFCDMKLSQEAIRLIFRDLQHACLPKLSRALSMSPREAEYVSRALRRHAEMIENLSAAHPFAHCTSPYGFSLLFWPYLSIFKQCLMNCVMPSSLSKFEQIRLLLLVCNTPEPPRAPGATAPR
ncbi:hypothetical protein BESB_040850 [Besnoitia besnoiti]|uniref:AP2-coincident C-terminal domain-containing protein n=1 Tax=Besnoitia besnoiti TaxID=94643 RepID=A0A2A9MNV3_BESBE|nr:hypothetical protein BESB_040850 [Besnoitia besnoiti]PFH37627.1 hypothetical protein BESB_040850 [Besnoitia besnoiti]